jgi:site-specific DNA-methyltransferase (adenine-specific)
LGRLKERKRLQVNRIHGGDSIAGMKRLPSRSVDLVVTDPPFAIEFKARRANYHRTASRVMEGYGEVPQEHYYDFTLAWMREAHRLLKATGSMYVFSGWNNLKDILAALEAAGFTVVNHLIWKYQFGVATRRRFVASHYHCLYACKDDKRRRFYPSARFDATARDGQGRSLRYRDMEDVWTIKREYWHGDKKTPTKLPRELLEKILAYSSRKGDVVLDPFLGSGQVAVVSKALGRKYVGFEIVKEYAEFARQRLCRDRYRIRHTDRGR